MARKKSEGKRAPAGYTPTEQEKAIVEKFINRQKTSSRVSLKISESKGALTIGIAHPDELVGHALIMEALGTADEDFRNGLISQLVRTGSQGRVVNEEAINFMLSVVKGIQPRDQVEAMLAAQMAAVHVASMTFAGRLARVETIEQQDSAERAFNKLTRTFAAQMEALKRYRTGGEQKVTVQHVSVSEGGQAIVGNVTQAPRPSAPVNSSASPPAIADAKSAPIPITQEGDRNKERVSAPARRAR